MADVDFGFITFVTILLNRPYRSHLFIYFKASFSCQKHQGKIYKTQRILVANLATNFWILVASTIILVALATVLGAISYPGCCLLFGGGCCFFFFFQQGGVSAWTSIGYYYYIPVIVIVVIIIVVISVGRPRFEDCVTWLHLSSTCFSLQGLVSCLLCITSSFIPFALFVYFVWLLTNTKKKWFFETFNDKKFAIKHFVKA